MERTLDEIIAAALTAKGSGPLSFLEMMEALEAGRGRALTVSTVDATSDNGWRPRPEYGFHLDAEEIGQLGSTPQQRADAAHRLAADYYSSRADTEGVEFEVWFWKD